MLTSAHKSLLEQIARKHAQDLRSSLRVVRAHLDPSHPRTIEVEQALQLTEEAVRELVAEPERTAA